MFTSTMNPALLIVLTETAVSHLFDLPDCGCMYPREITSKWQPKALGPVTLQDRWAKM